MSEENLEPSVETMQRAIEAWNREDLDGFLATWHPECEWRPAFPRSLEGVGVVYQGREGIARAWQGVRGVWKEYRLEPEDAQIVGDQLVAVGRVIARGIASDLELDSGWSALASFRDGLAIRAWDWLDRNEAFRAAGLGEWAMSQGNVEVVERAMAAYSTSEPLEDLFDPEIEIWESPDLPGEFVGKGYANLARGRRTLRDLFEEWSIEVEKSFDLGERVLVFVNFRATGRGSGAAVEGPLAYLVTLRDGRIIEWCLFGDQSDALKAAGRRE